MYSPLAMLRRSHKRRPKEVLAEVVIQAISGSYTFQKFRATVGMLILYVNGYIYGKIGDDRFLLSNAQLAMCR